MIGIYKITNKNNNMCYIGQSIDIQQRWQNHKEDSFCSEEVWKENKRKNQTYFHKALRKYGADAFLWEVIEECDKSQLDDREKYWIKYYDSFNTGYNMTLGGDGYKIPNPEDSPGAKLTKQESNIIKEKLKLHWTVDQIKTLIPKATPSIVCSINYGKTWYDETENYPISIDNGHRKWSDEQALQIKREYANGATIGNLSKKYNANMSTISDLVKGISYQNLPVLQREVEWNRISSSRKFTNDEVVLYRKLAKSQSMLSIYKQYKIQCNYAAFRNMIRGLTYKDVDKL